MANLQEVLIQGKDAGGLRIENLGEPINDQDAVNRLYMERFVFGATYRTILNQTADNDPVATMIGNNTLGDIVWTRISTGNYKGTLNGFFPAGVALLICSHSANSPMGIGRLNDNEVLITTTDYTFTFSDGKLVNTLVEISIYA